MHAFTKISKPNTCVISAPFVIIQTQFYDFKQVQLILG